MKNSPKPSGHQPDKVQPDAVQGEGDYKSAKTYGQAVRSFVQSERVGDAAQNATSATPQKQEAHHAPEPAPDALPLPVEPDKGPTPDLLPDDPGKDGVTQPVASFINVPVALVASIITPICAIRRAFVYSLPEFRSVLQAQ